MADRAEIQHQYSQMSVQIGQFRQKIVEMEAEKYEHELVIKALEPMDDDRKCFRLIGGVLVERTKKEVFPAVQVNLEQINILIENFNEQLATLEQASLDFRKEHDLALAQTPADGSSAGNDESGPTGLVA